VASSKTFGGHYPFINQGVAGQGFVASADTALRRANLVYCTTILSPNGTNSTGLGASTMYARSVQQGVDMAPREYWTFTLLPKSTSSASSNKFEDPTGADQTTDGASGTITSYNSLIKADPRCVDYEADLGLAGNLRKWRGSSGHPLTLDGVHPTSEGNQQPTNTGFSPADPTSIWTSFPTDPPVAA
jgi:hypothetical protein